MKKLVSKSPIILLAVFLTYFNSSSLAGPKREMRAIWIASVVNIDWPTRSGLTTLQQQQELIELLDLVSEWNMNTVIMQIRPAADAFYPSPFEPWSQWLTGTQGKAPSPYYDPLDFAIKECRRRGIDIHLWLNPYRAEMDTARHGTIRKSSYPKKSQHVCHLWQHQVFQPRFV
jgi:uncharacterized lipoprotein YddW (UPF0748 family)